MKMKKILFLYAALACAVYINNICDIHLYYSQLGTFALIGLGLVILLIYLGLNLFSCISIYTFLGVRSLSLFLSILFFSTLFFSILGLYYNEFIFAYSPVIANLYDISINILFDIKDRKSVV